MPRFSPSPQYCAGLLMATLRLSPVRARAPPSAASVICCRCLAQLAILFFQTHFFLVAAHPPDLCRYGRGARMMSAYLPSTS